MLCVFSFCNIKDQLCLIFQEYISEQMEVYVFYINVKQKIMIADIIIETVHSDT